VSVRFRIDYACEVNPDIHVLPVSATTGEGMAAWYRWLKTQRLEMSSA